MTHEITIRLSHARDSSTVFRFTEIVSKSATDAVTMAAIVEILISCRTSFIMSSAQRPTYQRPAPDWLECEKVGKCGMAHNDME